jgi:iron complex outermembrane receptor protein
MRKLTTASDGCNHDERMFAVKESRGWVGSWIACLTLIAAGSTAAFPVRAVVLDEIIVTAQKREQNLQDVPIAITAFNAEQIENLGLRTSTELASMTPGVTLTRSSGGLHNMFNIRGVAQQDFSDMAEAPNAVYVDEAYLVFTNAQRFAMFDMERVEILKGPQGTLFGRNATGGLAHFVTRKPTDTFEGYGRFTYGSYDQTTFEGAVSGPLSSRVSARAAVMYDRHDEITNNLLPGADDEWNENVFSGRGQLQWKINEDAELLLSGFGGVQDVATVRYSSEPVVPIFDADGNLINTIDAAPTETRTGIGPGGVATCPQCLYGSGVGLPDVRGIPFVSVVPGGDAFGYIDPDGRGPDYLKDFADDDENRYEQWGATAKLTWDVGDFTVTSITDYRTFDKHNRIDTDGAPYNSGVFPADAKLRQTSEELRINGELEHTRWVAGLYYLNYDIYDVHTGLFFPAVTVGGPNISPLAGEELATFADTGTDSFSVFGQFDYDLTDSVRLTGGLRVIWEDKDYQHVNQLLLYPSGTVLVPDLPTTDVQGNLIDTSVDLGQNDTLWSGKIQLDWTPMDNVLLYAGVNRGVKAGGFNQIIIDLTPFPVAFDFEYDPEVLWAYEGGIKSTWFDERLRLNASVYYYDYSDFQAFQFLNRRSFVLNADAENFGTEIELLANPVDRMELGLGLGYVDATVKDVPFGTGPGGATVVGIDKEPAFTPELTLNGVLRYEWPNVANGTIAAQASFNYSGSYYSSLTNFDAVESNAYVIGNFRLSYLHNGGHWRADFFINNIADEDDYEKVEFEVALVCGCSTGGYGPPRWFGGTLTYEW